MVPCRESTRIFPPIPAVKRYARESMALGPFNVAAGDMLCGASYTLHRDADLWENPTHFEPVSTWQFTDVLNSMLGPTIHSDGQTG